LEFPGNRNFPTRGGPQCLISFSVTHRFSWMSLLILFISLSGNSLQANTTGLLTMYVFPFIICCTHYLILLAPVQATQYACQNCAWISKVGISSLTSNSSTTYCWNDTSSPHCNARSSRNSKLILYTNNILLKVINDKFSTLRFTTVLKFVLHCFTFCVQCLLSGHHSPECTDAHELWSCA